MRDRLIDAISTNGRAFGLELQGGAIERLADYYELVIEYNPMLHLVAPCTPEEFAVRHILESLTLLEHLPENTPFADVGTGAGLPSIPCLIVREDLSAVLIESKEKKTKFLEHAAARLGFSDRVLVINRQFAEIDVPDVTVITCRAIDRFVESLPRIMKWGKGRTFAFFGGPSLREALSKTRISFSERLLPLSEQRFLFVFEN